MSEYESDEEDSESYYSDENDANTTLNCTNMDPALAALMGILIDEKPIKTDWVPPAKPGISNSDKIIDLYKNNDFFHKIKYDIRSCRKLDQPQLDYIKTACPEEKYEIIEVYNELMTNTKK